MIRKDSDLSKNLLLFLQALRKKRVKATTDNLLSVLKGILFIDLREKRDFYHLLKAHFVSCKEEIEPFDELFKQFWSLDGEWDASIKEILDKKRRDFEEGGELLSIEHRGDELQIKEWASEEEGGVKEERDLLTYSPKEILRRKDFGRLQLEEIDKVKKMVMDLSRRMSIRLSRRWKGKKRGDQIDFRKSIRQSIKYGGEMVELRMRQPRLKPLRVLLICDVSGSMDIYSQYFLLFMYGIQNYYSNCKTFTFSTRLSHTTFLLKGRTFEEALRHLSMKVLDWSGGTNIGVALHQLHQHYSHLLHPRRSLVLIFSDGWDRGDTTLLNSEMRYLKSQVRRIIWLNPLSGSRNYQPLCKGMSTALPYIDHFLPYENLSSLQKLCGTILKI